MSAVITAGIPDIRTEVHEAKSRQLQEWFEFGGWIRKIECNAEVQREVCERTKHLLEDWFKTCDWILDVHRSRFVFRQPTSEELVEHKMAVGECIETCRKMAAHLVDDRSSEIRDLASRLQTRIWQLEEAYNTFHDPDFSSQMAENILNQVFPE